MSSAKILSLDELEKKASDLRREGKCVVMCHGTFDLMHTGHIRHLQRAKLEGDVLLAYKGRPPGSAGVAVEV